ncbi:MAG: TAXI family TRAP transporter solute-binding subunit [Ruminiclostridium sp.]|mgnify:CR=1 FL=1|nr:TAXI family TRAP transporter solute-binding subunit [Ruminiclostridium sp.]
MKKIFALTMAVVMALGLCACGGSSDDGSAEGGAVSLSMATGGTSGTYYGFCGVVGQVLNEKMADSLNITVVSSGASAANIDLVETGANELAIVQNDVMYYAYSGTDMYAEKAPYENYSAVMSCYPEYVQIIANKNITSIDDLKGKKVSVGDAGSGVEFNARQILAAYGIDIDSDITKNNQGFADSADSLKNGTIDAAFVVAGYPTTAVAELASTYNFNILAVDQEHADALMADYGFYTYGVIPGNTYSCVAEDVPAVAVMATIIARNDVSEDTIYNFVKGMFDYQADITTGHAKGAELSLETAVSGVDIPFHPGAVKYFTEAGVMTAE